MLAVQAWIAAAFYLFILITSNPFLRVCAGAARGRDLNPILQDLGLAIHPPLLYLGYVGFSISFSFAIAALIEGRIDAAWARWVRPWTLAAWMFLTLGIDRRDAHRYLRLRGNERLIGRRPAEPGGRRASAPFRLPGLGAYISEIHRLGPVHHACSPDACFRARRHDAVAAAGAAVAQDRVVPPSAEALRMHTRRSSSAWCRRSSPCRPPRPWRTEIR